MATLIEKLRDPGKNISDMAESIAMCREAADEIERLRVERDLALDKFAEVVEGCETAASYQGWAPQNPFKAIAQEIRKLKQT